MCSVFSASKSSYSCDINFDTCVVSRASTCLFGAKYMNRTVLRLSVEVTCYF